MGNGTSHTSRKQFQIGRYQTIPVTLADGSVAYLLLDNKGRVINILMAKDASGNVVDLRVDSVGRVVSRLTSVDGSANILDVLLDSGGRIVSLLSAQNDNETVDLLRVDSSRSLHTTHSSDLMNISVVTPGVAYANGTNALCLAAPTAETYEIEIVSVWISAKAAGDFYLVVDNLGVTPRSTTNNTFDLVGIKGDGVTDTCDVVWGAFFAAQGRGATGGEYHTDCGLSNELYLIAPNVDYNIVVAWLNEIP